MRPIAHIYNGFETKFGIPRQGGIVNDVVSTIIFEKEFSMPEAFRGLEEYSHIWVLWEFSEVGDAEFSPTVRPPRLGGNKRMGVFATRSPYRPNRIGLSVLKLGQIGHDPMHGTVLTVRGADIKSGTPIYDIKPYLPEFDCITDARGGFSSEVSSHFADVDFPQHLYEKLPVDIADCVKALLAHDPKPSYQHDGRVYGMRYSGYEIKFSYNDTGLVVLDVIDTKHT